MDKKCIVDQLGVALAAIGTEGGTIEKRKECPSSEYVIRMPCFAAFFSIVESSENLGQIYAVAEKEIRGLQAIKGSELPRDVELVLLVASDHPPDPGLVRRIADDRYVCRKFVLWPHGRSVDEVLADLPFWPVNGWLSGTPVSVAAGVQEVVSGYDPRLIGDLASHSPGAERVFMKIQEGVYSLTGELSAVKSVQTPRAAPSIRRNLEALDITDFRGIRRLQAEDIPLCGDVVFIYGPNGVGKTSIADAVEWAITGQVNRLEHTPPGSARGERDPIVNVFSEKGEARVMCRLDNCEPVYRLKHRRSTERLIGSRSAVDDRAIIDYVVGTKTPSGEPRLRIQRLRSLFRGSHKLSQHDIRQFLEETKSDERFDILTNMIGAEEFVRFREKVAVVLQHLRSRVAVLAEQNESMKRELEDVSTRLRERQRNLESMNQAMSSGKTLEELSTELLQGISDCQCTIDEAAIERANAEPPERRFELIAVHADIAIRSKKAAIEDLLVRLRSLEQEVQGYVESRVRCESLAAEIRNVKNITEKTCTQLQEHEKERRDIQARLQILVAMQSEAARHYADLSWLKETAAHYGQGLEALRRKEDSLTSQQGELRRSEVALEEQQKSLNVKRTRLQKIEQTIATKTSRQQSLAALLKRLPNIQARRQQAEQLGKKERQLNSQTEQVKQRASSASGEVNEALARMDELQRAYNAEAARYDLLSSFLARLAELVRSAQCPLCGQDFVSADEAKDRIREHLSALPPRLRELASHLDKAKKDAETKQAEADSIAALMRVLQTERQRVLSSKVAATNEVQDFLAECAASAVNASVEDAGSWGNALEEARRQCEVQSLGLEAAHLGGEIKALASRVVEQQNAIGELRRRLVENETERNRLLNTVQGLEAEMVKRGFEPHSLAQGDHLAAELSKAKDNAREGGDSVARTGVELEVAESAIAGLRENLRTGDEDVSSKETQRRQYETTCSRFIAACRAISVDPDSPMGSIQVVKQKASELDRSLSVLEETRQVLQQVSSLGRFKSEIEGLARIENDVKQRAEAVFCEESLLARWVSHVERLQAEVVRRQVDVVGIHLERLEPTTQQLYCRLSPHPIFGRIRIRVNEKTRELDFEAELSVARERLGDIAVSPSAFFSDAQMNSLAITVFLAGAMRQRWSGFNTILIDDPVQQMDEMNVCAFLDLIRGLSSRRQFIIFTCSREFYLLALDKLACLNKSGRKSFLAYRLEGIAPAELKVHCDAP